MAKTTNGSSPPEIVERFTQIADLLKEINVIVKFISTDGDISFDKLYREYFEKKIEPNKSISDPFHLVKSIRSRLLPFWYFVEAIRSPLLSNNTRLMFLSEAFNIFKQQLNTIREVGSDSAFKQCYTSKSIGVLFADEIFLMRIMNTCIGLGIAIKYYGDYLAIQRVGTHDIELFFGIIRLLSNYDNSFRNAVRITGEAIMIKKFAFELGSPLSISKH